MVAASAEGGLIVPDHSDVWSWWHLAGDEGWLLVAEGTSE